MDGIETSALDVVHDEEGSRYVLRRAGEAIGWARYRTDGPVTHFSSTRVVADARGNGLGSVLVRHALDDVERRGGRIRSSCWFVDEFVRDHPEYAALVAD